MHAHLPPTRFAYHLQQVEPGGEQVSKEVSKEVNKEPQMSEEPTYGLAGSEFLAVMIGHEPGMHGRLPLLTEVNGQQVSAPVLSGQP